MYRQFRSAMLLGAILALGLPGHAWATISYVLVTNDADSGISSSNTYTHTLDFSNSTAGAAVVNGVTFDGITGTSGPLGFTRTVANGSVNNHSGEGVVSTSGGLRDLMQGFLYNSSPATDGTGLQTYTISGLTPGTTYDLRIYTHLWTNGTPPRPNTLVFDVGGENLSTGVIDQDDSTSVGMTNSDDSYYINYRYTATGSSLVWTAANSAGSNASFHLYGLTNQVVPEPSTCILSALGSLLLLRRSRKQ